MKVWFAKSKQPSEPSMLRSWLTRLGKGMNLPFLPAFGENAHIPNGKQGKGQSSWFTPQEPARDRLKVRNLASGIMARLFPWC